MAQEKTPGKDFVDAAWDFFTALRLSIVLFILIASVLITGTFIPQGEDAQKAQAVYAAKTWNFLDSIGAFDIYHTWWFSALLLLLGLNLLACTIHRLPAIWDKFTTHRPTLDDAVLANAHWKDDFPLRKGETPDSAIARAGALLKDRFGGFTTTTDAGGVTLWHDRGRLSRVAFLAVHTSLLIILVGSIVSSAAGKDGFVYISEGSEVDYFNLRIPGGGIIRHELPFSVRCDKFVFEKFADGRPKSYRSSLTVLEGGKKLYTTDIAVNTPLEHGDFHFYQSSYQPDPSNQRFTIEVTETATGKKAVGTARRGGEIAVAGGAFTLDARYLVVEHNPDFGSFGDAVRIAREPAEGERSEFWIFKRFPKFDAQNRPSAFSLSYRSSSEAFATGLQVSRDPGTFYVFLGSAIMLIGLFAAFFMSHRQVWVAVRGDRITVAAAASRNPRGLEPRVREFLDAFKPPKKG